MLPTRIASAPKPLVGLLGIVLLGTMAYSFLQPLQLSSIVIKLALFIYLAWGVLGGRKSARVLLSLFLLFSIGLNAYQIREDPDLLSSESVIQALWTIALFVTAIYMWFAPAARQHYDSERKRNAPTEA